jgi:hypothetical protein
LTTGVVPQPGQVAEFAFSKYQGGSAARAVGRH